MIKKSHYVLHVAGSSAFIPSFIDFVEDSFGLDDHYFWLSGDENFYSAKQSPFLYRVKKTRVSQIKGLFKLMYLFHKSDKIILHGLFTSIVPILWLMPWVLKKSYWLIWGGDLYFDQIERKKWKWKVKEFFRRPVIKNMGHLVTYIPGDVKLAREWYGAKGEYHECLMYLSNVFDSNAMQSEQVVSENHDGLNLLVGNSAHPSNNHIESLEKLLPYKDKEIKIFAPLSYGDKDHANKVIEKGKAWFGDKFIPLTSFMKFGDYINLLKKIDIAIFNHNRQQAMGNTITLLSMKKTVIMRRDVSHYDFLTSLGLVLSTNIDSPLKKIDKEALQANSQIISDYFSKDNLKKQFSLIFKG